MGKKATIATKNPLQKKYDFKDDKKLRDCFNPQRLNLLASTIGLIQRDRKFSPMALISIMVFGESKSYQVSLTEKCQYLLEMGIKITKQGLDKRLNEKAAIFLKRVMEELLSTKLIDAHLSKLLKTFKSIIVIDATSFQLPNVLETYYRGFGGGATTSGVKTHYLVDITSSGNVEIEVTHAAGSDTTTNLIKPQRGVLYLFDLGYLTYARLINIATKSAFYLCRIKYDAQVWTETENGLERLVWADEINKMREGQIKELSVFIGSERAIKSRLIIEKVPKKIANEKRRKLKTDKVNKRKGISEGRLAFCDLNAFITNASTEQIPTNEARPVYGLRWQIEIYFKTWKSYMNIDKIQKMNIHRFNCTHYGTLIYIILTSKIFFYFKLKHWDEHAIELSELKAMKLLANRKDRIKQLLFEPVKYAKEILADIVYNLVTHCIKERKYNRPTPYEVIKFSLS